MAQYPLHRFFVYNGEMKPNDEFIVSENAGGVYEVIRVDSRIPLFIEEHLDRFCVSARLANLDIRFTRKDIALFLSQLILKNKVGEGNILLSYKHNLKAFFIPHKYPDDIWYTTGVSCGLLHAERENPNAKVFLTSVRQKADDLIVKGGYYEVLLVDNNERVTEGSRSNVFFVSGKSLITPPGKEVLLGITRQKTLFLADRLNIPVQEQEILLKDVESYDAAFITGTSPQILPVSRISEWHFDSKNTIVQQLKTAFNDLIKKYTLTYRLPG